MFINAIYTTEGHIEKCFELNASFKCNLCLEINRKVLQQDDDWRDLK